MSEVPRETKDGLPQENIEPAAPKFSGPAAPITEVPSVPETNPVEIQNIVPPTPGENVPLNETVNDKAIVDIFITPGPNVLKGVKPEAPKVPEFESLDQRARRIFRDAKAQGKPIKSEDAWRVAKEELSRESSVKIGNAEAIKPDSENNPGKVEKVPEEQIKSPEGARTTPEEIRKELKEEREKNKQNKENALAVLSEPEVLIKRRPREIIESFNRLTENELGGHRDLLKERNEMAEKKMKEEHMVVVRGKDAIEKFRQKITANEQERILVENRSKSLDALWKRNPEVKEEEKGRFLFDIKKRLGLDAAGINGDIALDKLINDGYAVEKAKNGWFSSKIKIPKTEGKGILVYGNKRDLFQQTLEESRIDILYEAQRRAELKIIEGRKRLLVTKSICTKIIIDQTVKDYNLEKQKQEAEQKEKEARKFKKSPIVIPSAVGQIRSPEQIEEMRKIRKEAEASIRNIREARKKKEKLEKQKNKPKKSKKKGKKK